MANPSREDHNISAIVSASLADVDHTQRAETRFDTKVVAELEKLEGKYNSQQVCATKAKDWSNSWTRTLTNVLDDPDPDHKGDKKGGDTQFSPVGGEPEFTLENSVYP
jgi:hypothetical protein